MGTVTRACWLSQWVNKISGEREEGLQRIEVGFQIRSNLGGKEMVVLKII